MATITPLNLNPITERTGGTTVGQLSAAFTPAGGGDNILLNGTYLLLEYTTSGTAITITLDSVELSSYGTDVNPTIVMGTTEHWKALFYIPDLRFVQPSGAGVPGSLAVTYSAVTNLSGRASIIS